MGPAVRLRRIGSDGADRATRIALVVGLAALIWAAASEHITDGAPKVPIALLAVTAVAWGAWLASRRLAAPTPVTWVALAILAATGGAVGGLAPVGIAFPAVAIIAAATLVGAMQTAIVALIGTGAITATVLAAGNPRSILAEGVLACAAAYLGGATRRQYRNRAVRAEQLLAERVRADAERDRAAALAERNRLAREIHDVLAHSLGAVSVQLDAADALLETTGDPAPARKLVQEARGLVVDGLGEARKAVRALRGEPVALGEQLAALAAATGAELTVTGAERGLAPDAELALYRAAQEAVSNARKHAPGAEVTLRLEYGSAAAVLVVDNGPAPSGAVSPLRDSGGGYGLAGMRERIEAVGGTVSAAPDGPGWTVRVEVPA